MTSEKNGYWSIDVPGAKAGDEYRYLIHAPADWNLPPLSRIDPYARKVTNAMGNGIIYEPQAFDWGDTAFQMATGNELVIYEMHIGTFHVKEEGKPGTFDSAIEKFTLSKRTGYQCHRSDADCRSFRVTFRGATIRRIPLLLRVFTVGRMRSSDL